MDDRAVVAASDEMSVRLAAFGGVFFVRARSPMDAPRSRQRLHDWFHPHAKW
jgi:hypothetical protein